MKSTFNILSVLFFSFYLLSCAGVKPASSVDASLSKQEIAKRISLQETKAIITELASDKYLGRQPGTAAYDSVTSYVVNNLAQNGVKPFFEVGYLHNINVSGRKSANILGLIGEKTTEGDYILIGAHLDHIGTSGSESDSIYNGANDNATGVTAVLQIAKALSQIKLKKPVLVALFSEEESGLKGSEILAKELKEMGVKISEVFNFEMIGTTLTDKPGKVYITGYKKSNMAEKMNEVAGSEFVTFLPEEELYSLFMRSDNYPFYTVYNIPSQTLSSFDFKNYNFYHELDDEVEALNLENMHDIIVQSAFVIAKLIEEEVVIELK